MHRQVTDGASYETGHVYNLAGALVEETYLSGNIFVTETASDQKIIPDTGEKPSLFATLQMGWLPSIRR